MVITDAGHAVLELERDQVLSRWVEQTRSLDAYDWRIRRVFAPMIPKNGCVIDCGAFLGSHTTVYAETVGPGGLVVAVEPSPKHAECLRYNVRNLPQVWVIEAALFSEETNLWLAPNFFNAGMSVMGGPEDLGAFEVKAIALDSLEWQRVDFMKVDVEGLVLRVLEGARRLLLKHRPLVVAEVGDNLQLFGDTTEDVIAFMANMNYRTSELPTLLENEDTSHQRDLLFTPVEAA